MVCFNSAQAFFVLLTYSSYFDGIRPSTDRFIFVGGRGNEEGGRGNEEGIYQIRLEKLSLSKKNEKECKKTAWLISDFCHPTMATIPINISCKELKISLITQFNQLFLYRATSTVCKLIR